MKMRKLMEKLQKEKEAEKQAKKKKRGEAADFAVVGETLVPIKTLDDALRLAQTVEASRTTVGHNLNDRSSRSHCLVHLHVTEKTKSSPKRSGGGGGGGAGGKGDLVVRKRLLLVDLAGSERIVKSGVEGVAAQQAIAINKSLSALGRVIEALNKGKAHVPYRDSTLTMLLRSSFGGRSRTAVVVNVAEDAIHYEETLCSLQFGKRLAQVKNRATKVVGEHVAGEKASLGANLKAAEAKLKGLASQGHGERFGYTASPAQIEAFQKTQSRLAKIEAEMAAIRAGGGGGRGLSGSAATARSRGALPKLRAEANTLRQNIANAKKAVDRLSKEPFYHAPTRAYVAAEAEVKELRSRLAMLEV